MYVCFFCFLLFTYTKANNSTSVLHSKMNRILTTQHEHTVQIRDIQNELESLRFTVNLWCYLNIGFIIVMIYVSWKTYKRQSKMNEWRL
jgi:hypothetical protein